MKKLTKAEAIRYITESPLLPSPLEEAQSNKQGLSPLIQKMREAKPEGFTMPNVRQAPLRR